MSDLRDWWSNVAWFPHRHLFESKLVYHRQLPFSERRVEGDGVRLITACGITTDHWDRETGERFVDRGMLMRRSYADLFARPCRKCWP